MSASTGASMNFWEHLIELRSRIIRSLLAVGMGMAISVGFLERHVFTLALKPLEGRNLMFLGLGEGFTTHLALAFALGVILALPVIAWQAWSFVAPGLYPGERRATILLAVSSTVLFATGITFAYWVLLPVVVRFFLSFEEPGLVYGGALGQYLRLVAGLVIGAGVAFQFPLVLLGLIKSGLISRRNLSKNRGYWILAIVTAAAILTPTGDIVTQLLLAIPMWLLYEAALVVSLLGGHSAVSREMEAETPR